MLGTELDLRLLNYRDTTPLTAGQVDDEPYGGGAGMVLRVDVVAAALDAAYGGGPEHRVVALTPQGRQLDQQLVEELAGEEQLTLLSARFEGFDERIVEHLATDAISIGPYVLSGGELPAMVLLDAIARRLPGALGSEESGRGELLRRARGRARVPALHAARRVSRLARARRPALGRPRADRRLAPRAEPREDPPEKPDRRPDARPAAPVAHRHRLGVTILGAVAIVLAIKAYVVNPYRIPSSSMEPTLHCAKPAPGLRWRASPTACSRTGSSTTSAIRSAARSSSSRRPPAAALACGGEEARSSSG